MCGHYVCHILKDGRYYILLLFVFFSYQSDMFPWPVSQILHFHSKDGMAVFAGLEFGSGRNYRKCGISVVVQFYPWFKFVPPLF